jgi:hypothetical protein
MAGLGNFITVADADRQETVEAAGHQGELQVAVDLHCHGRRQGIHVEEVDTV